MAATEQQRILRVPMDPGDFSVVKQWQKEQGLKNPGVGRRLARAIEEGKLDEP